MNPRPLLEVEPEDQNTGEVEETPSGLFRSFLNLLLFKIDWLQLIPVLVLLGVGVLFIYGTGQQTGGFAAQTFWRRHLMYMAVGGIVWLTLSILDYRWCGIFATILYPVSTVLLVFVLFFGTKYFGARSWIEIGSLNFQPSELAKFSLILLTSWILAFQNVRVNHPLWLFLIMLLAGVPVCLTGLQPDFGTASAMIPPVAAILFTAKLKWRYIIIAAILGITLGFGSYHFIMKPYQQKRIKVFLNPGLDPRNSGWNQIQAQMAVGSGGFTGKGFMNGTHNMLGYLPQKVANSDFIFPVIAEETGFLGAAMVVFMFILLFLSILRTALLAADPFGRYLCVGIAVVLFFHVFVNIAMSIRLCPVTGLPLPLVSYGGTFLVTTLAYLGIVHSVYGHREKKSVFDL